jgi:hypothetical protein
MCPTLVTALDQGKAYTWCPICRQNGNSQSPILRDGHVLKCNFGHQLSGSDLQRFGADMVKSTEIFLEQPTITDVAWKIFINPAVKTKLETKFSGRIMITIATLLAALADDSMVMITGEQAAELRKLGIHNGAEILSSVKQSKETARERDEAIQQVERFMNMIKAAGVPGA